MILASTWLTECSELPTPSGERTLRPFLWVHRLLDGDCVVGEIHVRGLLERPADVGTATRVVFLSVALWWLIFSYPVLKHVPEPPRRLELDDDIDHRSSVLDGVGTSEADAGLHDHQRELLQRAAQRIGMDRRKAARVPGVDRAQEADALSAAQLAEHDAVGAQAQRGQQQLVGGDLGLAELALDRDQADAGTGRTLSPATCAACRESSCEAELAACADDAPAPTAPALPAASAARRSSSTPLASRSGVSLIVMALVPIQTNGVAQRCFLETSMTW